MEEKHNNNFIFHFLLICIMLAIIAVLSSVNEQDNKQLYSHRALAPTAGVCYYLGSLEKACYVGAEPDMDYIESYFASVEAARIAEEDRKDLEEVENGRREALINYFGYVPTDDEISLWTQIVMDECGHTEPDSGISAVADVIANRCRDPRWPDTITGVVYQRGQFQPVGDATLGRFEVSERVYEICSDAISEGITYPYLCFRTGTYHQGRRAGEQIGHHYFSY